MTRAKADQMVLEITAGRFPTVEAIRKSQPDFDALCEILMHEQEGMQPHEVKVCQDLIDHLWGKDGEG